jgi:hypothetical protein
LNKYVRQPPATTLSIRTAETREAARRMVAEEDAEMRATESRRRNPGPPIFTAEYVETMGLDVIVQLLNDCYYDIVSLEVRIELRR